MTTGEQAKKLAMSLSDYLNSFGSKEQELIACMNNEHRTIQQSFTKLCLKWIENCASDEYRYDGRNEDSHEVSEDLISHWKMTKGDNSVPSNYLPMV